VPASWRLLVRDGRQWRPVTLVAGEAYATGIDTLHVVRFEPVTTAALRMEVQQQDGFGSGLYEWTVLRGGAPDQAEGLGLYLKRAGLVSEVTLAFDAEPPHAPPVACTVQVPVEAAWSPVTVSASERGPLRNQLTVRFAPVTTDRLRVRVQRTPGTTIRLLAAHAVLRGQPSMNLRTVKLPERVVLMVDGKQVLDIPGHWPPARVGLTAEAMQARFNGITCFHISPHSASPGVR
jgi:hypothetical protein